MPNIGPRLDRLPIGRFHHRLLGMIGFGMFFDGFEIYMTSVVAVPLVQVGWFTVGEIARFAAAMFFGLALGALVAGRLGDLYGRKTMYQVNLLIYSIGALLCACAPNLTTLLAFEAEVEGDKGTLPPTPARVQAEETQTGTSMRALFQSELRRRTLLGAVMWVIGNSVVFAFTIWMPTIFVQRGLSVVKSFAFTTVLAFGAIPGNFLGVLIADRWGRKWTLVWLSLLQAALILVYGRRARRGQC